MYLLPPPHPPTTFKHGFWKAVKLTNAPKFTSFCHINLLRNLTIYYYPLKIEVSGDFMDTV